MYFFFNDTATTEIYTLSLHDALPISYHGRGQGVFLVGPVNTSHGGTYRCYYNPSSYPFVWSHPSNPLHLEVTDRKSTRLNSSHANISYAVFCLKKKTLKQ